MPGLVGLAPTPRNRGLLSFRALNSLKKVFGAYHPAWLIAFSPFSNSVSLETVVTLTGKFCGSSGSFCAVTVIGGYGSIAVKGDRIFVQGAKNKESVIYTLSRADGTGIWSKALGPAGTNDRGSGPRGTPTVDGDRVYVLTERGDLACLKAQDGTA